MAADRVLHAANALVSLAALATAGGPIAAAGAGVSGLLSWRALRATPAAPDLEKELAEAMRESLSHPGVTEDQRRLIPQMIEAALPDPATVINAGLDRERLITAMEAALTDPEHRLEGNRSLFRATLRPALTSILTNPQFTETLGPAFIRNVVGQLQGLDQTTRATLTETLGARDDLRRVEDKIDLLPGQFAALMEDLPNATRTELVAVAHRFEIERAEDLTDTALRRELEERAKDWRALREQVAAIPETMQQLSNLKGAAQAAFDAGRFEEVETLLERVHEVELEEAARTAEMRAETALLRGRVEQAYHLFASTADSFAPIDSLEPARRRILRYVKQLHDHGRRYGGPGFQRGQDLLTPVLTDDLRQADAWLWAAGMNTLAVCLSHLGERTSGPEGAALLGQAVSAYRAALDVRTRVDHPMQWAITQNNLGNARQEQGKRTGGPEGGALMGQAVDAYSKALEVRTRADHPVDWATTQNNLGNALQQQGSRTGGPEGAALLEQAVDAYGAALEVRTHADYPVDWAATQNNLGNALSDQGERTGGSEGAALLGKAVDAYGAALKVRTRTDHPVQWATTQVNLAIVEVSLAQHDSCSDPTPHLRAALAHVEAALEVFDLEHTPYHHRNATALRDRVRAALDAAG